MIDFRYHAVSILGVFIALAVGIILGSIVGSDGAIEKQQVKLIESIQKDINTLREQTNKQSKELDKLKEISGELTSWAIAERLKGKIVAFLQMKGSNVMMTRWASEVVKEAGGESRIITADTAKINQYVDSEPDKELDILKKVADGAFASEVTTELAKFKENGFFSEEGSQLQAQYLVVVYDENNHDLIISLIKYLTESKKSPILLVNQQKLIKEEGLELVSAGTRIVLFNNDPSAKASLILSFDSPQGIYGTDLSGGRLIPERKE